VCRSLRDAKRFVPSFRIHHEVLDFRQFPRPRYAPPLGASAFTGISVPKPVKGGSLLSLRLRRHVM